MDKDKIAQIEEEIAYGHEHFQNAKKNDPEIVLENIRHRLGIWSDIKTIIWLDMEIQDVICDYVSDVQYLLYHLGEDNNDQ